MASGAKAPSLEARYGGAEAPPFRPGHLGEAQLVVLRRRRAPFRDWSWLRRFIVGLSAMRLRCCLPLNSVLPAKLLFLRTFRPLRGPEQCVQCALHENHASWPLGWDRGTWDVDVSRGAAACGARANCSGELDQDNGGGFQDSERDGAGTAGAAAAQRAAPGDQDLVAEIVLRAERGSVHRRGSGHAAVRIHAAAL